MLDAPFFDAFLKGAQSANVTANPGSLRRYQVEVLATGAFYLPSPWTGQALSPVAVFADPAAWTIFWFRDRSDFAVLTGPLHFGFPLAQVIWAGGERLIETFGGFASSPLAPTAQQLLADGRAPPVVIASDAPTLVYIGNSNFAHFMWNEYAALEQAIGATHKVEVNVLHDPLGIAQEFLSGCQQPHAMIETLGSHRRWHDRMVLPVAVMHLGQDQKDRLLRMCIPAPMPRATVPTIYVTVRDRGRTITRQAEFLSRLFPAILSRFPQSRIVTDGFTYPADIGRTIYAGLRPIFDRRCQGALAVLEAATRDLPEPMRGRMTDITGQGMREALAVIGTCTHYVAHAGTSQHKIGWFYGVPGTMHGNRASITPAALRWYAAQVAGSLAPVAPSVELIEDSDRIDLPNEVDRNRDYDFTDPDRVIAGILDHIAATHPDS